VFFKLLILASLGFLGSVPVRAMTPDCILPLVKELFMTPRPGSCFRVSMPYTVMENGKPKNLVAHAKVSVGNNFWASAVENTLSFYQASRITGQPLQVVPMNRPIQALAMSENDDVLVAAEDTGKLTVFRNRVEDFSYDFSDGKIIFQMFLVPQVFDYRVDGNWHSDDSAHLLFIHYKEKMTDRYEYLEALFVLKDKITRPDRDKRLVFSKGISGFSAAKFRLGNFDSILVFTTSGDQLTVYENLKSGFSEHLKMKINNTSWTGTLAHPTILAPAYTPGGPRALTLFVFETDGSDEWLHEFSVTPDPTNADSISLSKRYALDFTGNKTESIVTPNHDDSLHYVLRLRSDGKGQHLPVPISMFSKPRDFTLTPVTP
jgi:hypothetical protein